MKISSAWTALLVTALAATPGTTAPQDPAGTAPGNPLRKRPAYVNNAEQPYFPPVFNQDGGSCGSASRIGYMFTYEINALRGDTARTPEHIYPTHFTWLLTNSNSGKEGMAMANGVPNAATYGGTTYSRLFGNQDCASEDFGWMQGYDKWLEAMQNRIARNSFSPYGLDTEEGRELVKNWLWNHCGDTDFHAGGICGIGVASACKQGEIGDDPAGENRAAGLVGKKYVTRWGDGVDHALTIVGYDDRAVFDLDGNGLYGEPGKDERGAWIIVNSWGSGWANGGFIYCPYKYSFPVRQNEGGAWKPEFYHARKHYRPLRTLRVRMDYSRRSELKLCVGIAADTSATEPEAVVEMEHFKFAGDGRGAGRKWGVEALVPMLGRWADHRLHTEPMEFGYDLTDLSARFDTRRPLKYFFIIQPRDYAIGTGQIYDCSLLDYEFDRRGTETPFRFEPGTFVENAGRPTVLTAVVEGEPLFAPRNLRMEDGELRWDAPQPTHYALAGYALRLNGTPVDTLPATETAYFPDSLQYTFSIAALYAAGDTLLASAPTAAVEGDASLIDEETRAAGKAPAIAIGNGGFSIPDVFSTRLDSATLEFWIRPRSLRSWNQSIGRGWGSFLFHTNDGGALTAGWDGDNRIDSRRARLHEGRWQHVALTVAHNTLTLYLDGEPTDTLRAKGFEGIGGFGDFRFGTSEEGAIDGELSEIRVWGTALSPEEIRHAMYMKYEPAGLPDKLLAYYHGDFTERRGQLLLRDCAGGHHAAFAAFGTRMAAADAPALRPYEGNSRIAIVLPADTVAEGEPVCPEVRTTPDIVALRWTAPGAGADSLGVRAPELCFDHCGRQTIRLEALTADGHTLTAETCVEVTKTRPDATFRPIRPKGAAGERITFAPVRPQPGYRYEWSLPGGEETSARTMLAATTYPAAGEYEVSLRVTPPHGGRSRKASLRFAVDNVAPVADFTLSPLTLVKGGSVTLTDRSRYAPREWEWAIARPGDTLRLRGATPTLCLTRPGVYDVSLTAINEKGSGTKTLSRALTVCNADSRNGLNFSTPAACVTTDGAPYEGSTGGLTTEWWMQPTAGTSEIAIGEGEESWLLHAAKDGSLRLTADSATVSTAAGFVLPGGWHHYAVSFDRGRVCFLRDGDLIHSAELRSHGKRLESLPHIASLRIGGEKGPVGGVIDEFRLWQKALSTQELRARANAPVADVARAEREDSLLLYYDCNQNGGDLTDATSHGLTGRRSGFGPDGDAWGLSQGVFSLDFEEVAEDLTAQYLPQARAPFATDGSPVNKKDHKRFVAFAPGQEGRSWRLEKAVEHDSIRTGFYVDRNKQSALCVYTEWDGFAKALKNHKLYCTVGLPAGRYEFEVMPSNDFSPGASRLVAATGEGLPDIGAEGTRLADVPLTTRRVRFTLTEAGNVSLGIVTDLEGRGGMALEGFALRRLELPETEGPAPEQTADKE